ncbi:unnamed protein product [Effrenium voratum]|nr:unnamed protein product [Effrenium voratum]
MSGWIEVRDGIESCVRDTFLEFRVVGSEPKLRRSKSTGSIEATPVTPATPMFMPKASKISAGDCFSAAGDSSASTKTNSGCVSPCGTKEVYLQSAIEALHRATCQGKQASRCEVSDIILQLPTLADLPADSKSRLMSQLMWSLGKMQYKQVEVYALPDLIPSELVTFRTSDLCAMLWGSVKLGITELSRRIITALDTMPLRDVPPQSVANGMWCLGTLKLNTAAARSVFSKFLQLAVQDDMRNFTCQGVANSLWAAAHHQLDKLQAQHFLKKAVLRAMELETSDFQHEELCMAVWAVGRIIWSARDSRGNFLRGQYKCVQDWLLLAFKEATGKIRLLKPQGVSMIAITLKNLKQDRFPEARDFLLAAARELSGKVHECSGQALANLCHVFCGRMMVKLWPSETLEERAAYKAQVVVPFAAAVAKRLTSQVWDYSSRDLFAIASSFARAKLGHVQEVHDFAVALLNAPSNGSLTSQDSMNLVFLMNSGKQKFQAKRS